MDCLRMKIGGDHDRRVGESLRQPAGLPFEPQGFAYPTIPRAVASRAFGALIHAAPCHLYSPIYVGGLPSANDSASNGSLRGRRGKPSPTHCIVTLWAVATWPFFMRAAGVC
jgi:hypothetical protein